MRTRLGIVAIFVALGVAFGNSDASAQSGDPGLAMLERANARLAAMGMQVRVGEIEYFTFGQGRPSTRILQQPFRWVASDPRRPDSTDGLTYLVDLSDGRTSSGLRAAETDAAIDRAMATWDATLGNKGPRLTENPDPGRDPDIFDELILGGRLGDPFFADITHAGWLPRELFDALAPDGGHGILAVSVTFIFIDDEGNPTDINNDGYLDTALNEVYFNDNFGDRRGSRPGNPWAIDQPLPAIDVETVALHESGHSLGVGHFGPPPEAVMNPVYAGVLQEPLQIDVSALSTLYQSWPR